MRKWRRGGVGGGWSFAAILHAYRGLRRDTVAILEIVPRTGHPDKCIHTYSKSNPRPPSMDDPVHMWRPFSVPRLSLLHQLCFV